MRRDAEGPGLRLPGPSEAIYIRRDANGIPMLPHAGDDPLARRFGQPSNYSLSPRELTAHVRRLRREGWQSWEIRKRFTFGSAA